MSKTVVCDVLVVGSGVAVEAGPRTRGWQGAILLLDAEKETPYGRPPLSKELLKVGLVVFP